MCRSFCCPHRVASCRGPACSQIGRRPGGTAIATMACSRPTRPCLQLPPPMDVVWPTRQGRLPKSARRLGHRPRTPAPRPAISGPCCLDGSRPGYSRLFRSPVRTAARTCAALPESPMPFPLHGCSTWALRVAWMSYPYTSGGAGGARPGPTGAVRPRPRAHGPKHQGPRRQAAPRRHAGRPRHRVQPRWHRRHGLHPHRQTPRRWPSSACLAPRPSQSGTAGSSARA